MTPEQYRDLEARLARLEQPLSPESWTDADREKYRAIKAKWAAQDPVYCAVREAELTAVVDQACDRACPDWRQTPTHADAPLTPKQIWAALAAEDPVRLSAKAMRNGNAR